MRIGSFSDVRERFGPRVWWHAAGVAAVLLMCVALTAGLAFEYFLDGAEHQNNLITKRARLESLSNEVRPFRSIGKDIDDTRLSIAQFYADRIPPTYSQVLNSLGGVAIRSGVSLSHVAYSEGKPGSDLSEVSMDVSIAGDYPRLMNFVNGIEREKTFFVVRALSFTGQQGEEVTLHVRISTWMRTERPANVLAASVQNAAGVAAAEHGGGK